MTVYETRRREVLASGEGLESMELDTAIIIRRNSRGYWDQSQNGRNFMGWTGLISTNSGHGSP
jgi:hypothetical protein